MINTSSFKFIVIIKHFTIITTYNLILLDIFIKKTLTPTPLIVLSLTLNLSSFLTYKVTEKSLKVGLFLGPN